MRPFIEWNGHRVLGLLCRWYLGYIFLAACYHKILEPKAFAIDIATYQFLPHTLVNLVAINLPWIELAAGLLFVLGVKVRPAALLMAGMMMMFLIALGWALYQGLNLSCGCFASDALKTDPISYKTVLRDVAWLLIACYVLVFDQHPIGLTSWLNKREVS